MWKDAVNLECFRALDCAVGAARDAKDTKQLPSGRTMYSARPAALRRRARVTALSREQKIESTNGKFASELLEEELAVKHWMKRALSGKQRDLDRWRRAGREALWARREGGESG